MAELSTTLTPCNVGAIFSLTSKLGFYQLIITQYNYLILDNPVKNQSAQNPGHL